MGLEILKEQVVTSIDQMAEQLSDLAAEVHRNPELGLQEVHAANVLTEALAGAGFDITRGIGEYETAFIGKLPKGEDKPVIALLCEYDALPELGHACGHNLIGAASVGAGLALAALEESLPGTVWVIGAPGEETYAGKAYLTDCGVFKDVDAAMMFHPAAVTRVISSSSAIDALEFVFTGRAAHAAASPEMGINALDGVINMFNGVNALREHLPDPVRIHGIVSDGGAAPNIVPERAAARFYVRAPKREMLDEVVAKVKRCAEGGAMMAGAQVTWHHFEPSNDNLISNHAMAEAFAANLRQLGIAEIAPPSDSRGSTDMGNVSHVVPAIHPYISLGSEQLIGHTPEFAAVCGSPRGFETMLTAAKAIAMTTLDLLYQDGFLERVKAEFASTPK